MHGFADYAVLLDKPLVQSRRIIGLPLNDFFSGKCKFINEMNTEVFRIKDHI